ncbi:hypothetical protein A3B45_03995 [Candidatus Daviesbacteria bacterium RIFCSPLOWO2_01_FULL_39_12]|uniref:Uncharacterized protein n=1 Tax=Candidatus Daviesbacteria bacterium RIFCSPLOWO2_01_FULL_39_12 TaxID=1797785 RepID=A0A1F5KSZ9_9BACT|nr:MAG: hypothetical protein A3D79_01850 [Candidatus Daviesbacteria bacterium RIFCSPHIGHO2_02_FULL_39_8]OGE43741.1 MAG: hypothetical protein A3B45_03995 [Candidatus Daviesbacteria bacterium RIFCSPLOWO2_01_FULL_39_12]
MAGESSLEERVKAIEEGLKRGETVEKADRIRQLSLRVEQLRQQEQKGVRNLAEQKLTQARILGLSKPSDTEKLVGALLTGSFLSVAIWQGWTTYQDFGNFPQVLGQLKDAALTFNTSDVFQMLNKHNQTVEVAWRQVLTHIGQTGEHARNTLFTGGSAYLIHSLKPIAKVRGLLGKL